MMKNIKANMQKISRNALTFIQKTHWVHFVLLGLVFVILNILRKYGLVQTSMMSNMANLIIMSIATLGFLILLGYGGLASLGTSIFIFLGAAFARFFTQTVGLDFITSFLLVILIGVLVGSLIGFISLRISGMYLAIITLAIAEALAALFNLSFFTSFSGGSAAIKLQPIQQFLGIFKLDKINMFYIIIVVFVLILIITQNLTKSPAGRAMLAMKNSESAAQTMGVNLLKYRLFSFIISTIFAMIAGYLLIFYQTNVQLIDFNLNMSLEILAAVVIGGTGSIWGIFGGTFLIFTLKNILNQNVDFFRLRPNLLLLFNGVLMIVVVLFYPGGLSQLVKTAKYKIKAWYTEFVKKRKAKKLLTTTEEAKQDEVI